MAEINKKEVERLANLARLELHAKEEEKMSEDLEKILGHFTELQTVDTEKVQPMTGGTFLKNVTREDDASESSLRADKVVEQMPSTEKHFLKIPPVF